MHSLRQSVCLPILGLKRPERLIPALARIGYAAVEIWHHDAWPDFPGLVARARRHGLTVASMCGHRSLDEGMNCRAHHAGIERELRATIEVAARHGVPGLICFAGRRRPGQSDRAGLQECARLLRRAAPWAERHGVTLNVELLNSKIDHPGYLADRTEWGAALCEEVGHPSVKLLYDIYHLQIMEGDLIRTIERHHRWIGHFHTAGHPGRHELDDRQEINYRAVFRAIAATGYAGYVGHEFRPRGSVLKSLNEAHALGVFPAHPRQVAG